MLLGIADEDNAFTSDNAIEGFPEFDKSTKLQLNFFHSSHRVNDEFTVQKCLKWFRGMTEERLPLLTRTTPASFCF